MKFQEEIGVAEVVSKLERGNVSLAIRNDNHPTTYLELLLGSRKLVQTPLNRIHVEIRV